MIPFGKKIRVGNYELVKVSKSLNKEMQRQLRDAMGVPDEYRKHLSRGTLPCIIMSDISGSVSVSWMPNMIVFAFIEDCFDDGGNIKPDMKPSLTTMLTPVYGDVSVIGDKQFIDEKVASFNALMQREAEKRNKEEKENKDGEADNRD